MSRFICWFFSIKLVLFCLNCLVFVAYITYVFNRFDTIFTVSYFSSYDNSTWRRTFPTQKKILFRSNSTLHIRNFFCLILLKRLQVFYMPCPLRKLQFQYFLDNIPFQMLKSKHKVYHYCHTQVFLLLNIVQRKVFHSTYPTDFSQYNESVSM